MPRVVGVDSSTQSRQGPGRRRDDRTGALAIRDRRRSIAPRSGTRERPQAWWDALSEALHQPPTRRDDGRGGVRRRPSSTAWYARHPGDRVRPALLWNDIRSAPHARRLVAELGGPEAGPSAAAACRAPRSRSRSRPGWPRTNPTPSARPPPCACRTTTSPGASGTAHHRPRRRQRHRLLVRGAGEYRTDLLDLAFGRVPHLPTVLGPHAPAGLTPTGVRLGPGTGDNAAAALGLGAQVGDVIVSIGTSGTVFSVATARRPTPPVRWPDSPTRPVTFCRWSAPSTPPACSTSRPRCSASTTTNCPPWRCRYRRAPTGWSSCRTLEGERTPNRPRATGALHGMRLANSTRTHLARAAVEGMLCALADGLDALVAHGVPLRRVVLVGGAARSAAVRAIAPTVFGVPVSVPPAGEWCCRRRRSAGRLDRSGSGPASTVELIGDAYVRGGAHAVCTGEVCQRERPRNRAPGSLAGLIRPMSAHMGARFVQADIEPEPLAGQRARAKRVRLVRGDTLDRRVADECIVADWAQAGARRARHVLPKMCAPSAGTAMSSSSPHTTCAVRSIAVRLAGSSTIPSTGAIKKAARTRGSDTSTRHSDIAIAADPGPTVALVQLVGETGILRNRR